MYLKIQRITKKVKVFAEDNTVKEDLDCAAFN